MNHYMYFLLININLFMKRIFLFSYFLTTQSTLYFVTVIYEVIIEHGTIM